MCIARPNFYMDVGDSNLVLHACTAGFFTHWTDSLAPDIHFYVFRLLVSHVESVLGSVVKFWAGPWGRDVLRAALSMQSDLPYFQERGLSNMSLHQEDRVLRFYPPLFHWSSFLHFLSDLKNPKFSLKTILIIFLFIFFLPKTHRTKMADCSSMDGTAVKAMSISNGLSWVSNLSVVFIKPLSPSGPHFLHW